LLAKLPHINNGPARPSTESLLDKIFGVREPGWEPGRVGRNLLLTRAYLLEFSKGLGSLPASPEQAAEGVSRMSSPSAR